MDTPYDRVVSTLKTVLAKMVGINPDEIGLNATFPEMGADSLFLLEVSHVIRDKFGVKVPFRSMLQEYSTIDLLATFITARMPSEERPAPAPMPVPEVAIANSMTPTEFVAETPVMQSPTGSISESAIERVLTQQMRLMSQQLQMLQQERQRPTNGSHKAVTPAPEVIINSNGNKKSENIPITPATPATSDGKQFVPASYTAHTSIKKDSNEGLSPRQRKHIDELIARLTARTQGSKQTAQDYR